MAILSIVDYATALQYKGGNLSTKHNGKKQKLYLKLTCDDYTLKDAVKLMRESKNIIAIDYQGYETNPDYIGLVNHNDIYITRQYDFGNNITDADVSRIMESTPSCVHPVINLPEDFKNLYFVNAMCRKYPRVRFSGGILFNVADTRIGCVGIDILEKAGIKFEPEMYMLSNKVDVLEVANINDLDIDVSLKPEKAPKKTSSSSGAKKTGSSTPKKSKPTNSFASLLLKHS